MQSGRFIGNSGDIDAEHKLSFCNNLWKLLAFERDNVVTISEKYKLPYLTALLLVNRNVQIDSVNEFINPKLKNLMPNPFILSDMEKAVNRIIRAIYNNEYICIFGDYDVDGATSSALLYKFLIMIGYDENKIKVHIPDRISEGYGLNIDFIKKLNQEQNYKLIITVDCGVTAISEVELANSYGIDVVIIDHHQPEENLPKAVAVVNPKKNNEKVDYSYMAAVGVCFFTIFAIHNKLQEIQFYKKNNIAEPNLILLLDLVALGTVCDVVPLIGINRAFINTGLQVMSNRTNIGIKSLCDVSNINTKLTTYHLGFVLGPRINAGGRIGNSSTGVKLLCSKNPVMARCYAEQLDNYNLKRREMEEIYLNEIYENLNIENCQNNGLIFISGKNWHTGVIGIISGKIKEKYKLPTFIASIDETSKLIKGSARSIKGLNIGKLILKAKDYGIIKHGGGHPLAAGFTCHMDKESSFINFLQDEIKNELKDRDLTNILKIDAIIDVSAINLDFAKSIDILSPYGESNPEPIFLVKNVRLIKVDIINNLHLSCIFTNTNDCSVRTISFKALNTNMGQVLLNNIGKSFDIVGKIRINNYKGSDSVSFFLEDANFYS